MITHMSSCVFFFVGVMSEDLYDGSSWILDQNLSNATLGEIYVTSYLQGTSHFRLMSGGRDYVSKPCLSAYVDANYVMCPDTRRCLSKKQGIVTISPTKAEFVALALCIQECLNVRQLTAELHHTSDQPISVHEDYQSAFSITKNSEHHERSKHIDVRFMFVRDFVENKEFILHYSGTSVSQVLPRSETLGDYLCGRVP
ncbi:hypothetical protein AaE_007695 [Aphanomyces astaci]|uniref:Reverse transcriptase Ty1/copia-type domain-containing protein n=1 Tax=Aphanomyces astaci TaxID=112090 RepID=A0A6A5A9Y3_APHAT|nr:hypothetical protein AaE_007695 [Aphanomyces astaci]